jgi:hypothetical protein
LVFVDTRRQTRRVVSSFLTAGGVFAGLAGFWLSLNVQLAYHLSHGGPTRGMDSEWYFGRSLTVTGLLLLSAALALLFASQPRSFRQCWWGIIAGIGVLALLLDLAVAGVTP